MRIGVHLPQYGRVASAAAVRAAAVRAEDLGYADLWVSDHVVHPVGQDYPSPHLLDPLMTLAWAGAVTRTIGLGTSVLVAAQHNPLELANALASLDALSEGRLTVGIGVGWSRAEFDALGHSFGDRGRRTDEIIDVLRACWAEDPVSFDGAWVRFAAVRVLPKPAHTIPIWIGASSAPGYRRAIERGDGFHLIGVTPDEARPVVDALRAERPDPSFTISLRTGWDPQGMDPGRIRDEYAAYGEAGVQHVTCAPWRTTLDEWLRSMELLAELLDLR